MRKIVKKISDFQGEAVEFVEATEVKEGVVCDVYAFEGSDEKDLGIVSVRAGSSTPLQKVLKGDRTIEELIEGEGTLTITGSDGQVTTYEQSPDSHEAVEVKIGELVQWTAKTDMVFCEICYPPYKDGRFENLPD